MTTVWTLLKKTWSEFSEDDCMSLAAALAYYTVFALPPLLVLIVMMVSFVWDPTEVKGEVNQQLANLFGERGARQVQTMMNNATENRSGLAAVLGLIALVAGATGAFSELQTALNRAWQVAPDPKQSGIKTLLVKRLISFALILVIALLLLVSMLLSTILSAFGDTIAGWLPGQVTSTLLRGLNLGISFLVVALLFAAIFKWLPDAKISWKDVATGAVATAVLFMIGKILIGLYLGHTNMASTYGAAGSLVLVLVWIYYSSVILLLGAEFTQVWAGRHGNQVQPREGAVRVVRKTQPQ
jgi:membrane protein